MNWQQKGLDIDGESVADYFGLSVSLSADGHTMAVGANNYVRVYDWYVYSGEWKHRGGDIVGEIIGDNFGFSVSLSANGNTIAIGAPGRLPPFVDSGYVRVYDWNVSSGEWVQRGLDIDGEAGGDQSGYSVSLSANGNTVAIGARLNDVESSPNTDSGHVRVYDWHVDDSFGEWVQRGGDIDGEAGGDWSGYSVSLSADGNTIAIGAIFNDGGSPPVVDSGHVRVYDWHVSSGEWVQRGLDIDGEAKDDLSGYSVSLSADGNTIAIGAIFNDGGSPSSSNSGHVRVYDWHRYGSSGEWVQRGLDIDGEAGSDRSGYSVSLSADGNTVAIGAPYNNGRNQPVIFSGHVRVYDWHVSSGEWVQRGLDIDGEADIDLSGYSVSLSADGNTIAIGAILNNGGSPPIIDSGHVRVYNWPIPTSITILKYWEIVLNGFC